MDMNLQINRLLNFALQQGLIAPEDKYYSANLLLDLLGVDEFEVIEVDETLPIAHDILENMLDYAVEKGLCEDTVTQRDLFDTRIMNCVMPRPSEVVGNFKKLYEKSKVQATDYFYKTNYIRKIKSSFGQIHGDFLYHKYCFYLNKEKIDKIFGKQIQ